jgi:hypothetical protein
VALRGGHRIRLNANVRLIQSMMAWLDIFESKESLRWQAPLPRYYKKFEHFQCDFCKASIN